MKRIKKEESNQKLFQSTKSYLKNVMLKNETNTKMPAKITIQYSESKKINSSFPEKKEAYITKPDHICIESTHSGDNIISTTTVAISFRKKLSYALF
jgi:hypothetical protein